MNNKIQDEFDSLTTKQQTALCEINEKTEPSHESKQHHQTINFLMRKGLVKKGNLETECPTCKGSGRVYLEHLYATDVGKKIVKLINIAKSGLRLVG